MITDRIIKIWLTKAILFYYSKPEFYLQFFDFFGKFFEFKSMFPVTEIYKA